MHRCAGPAILAALFLAAVALEATAQEAPQRQFPAPDSPEATEFGYPSPAAALPALKARGDVTISEYEGWTSIEDRAKATFWSFTPDWHSAHPTCLKRVVVRQPNGALDVVISYLCEAPPEECERLVARFRRETEVTRGAMETLFKALRNQ